MTKLLTIGGPAVPAQELGIVKKPHACKVLCPSYSVGEGYVMDTVPKTAKLLLCIGWPSAEDLVNRKLLSGRAGWSFFQNYVKPLGYTQEDYGVCGLMRCRPPKGKMMLGRDKKSTVEACRHYDQQEIKKFNPDTYIISQSLKDVYQENAFHSLMISDIKKAFRFAAKGMRPIVLMGTDVAEVVAPYIIGQGGTKKWRGSWQEMNVWPFLQAGNNEPKPKSGFSPAARW